MPRAFFTAHHLLFLLFLVIAHSQLGFGQYDYTDDPIDKYSQNFTAVSSLFYQPGTDYNVFFAVHPSPSSEPLQLKCVLMAKSNHNLTIQSQSIYLQPGESGQISIPLPREMPGNETQWHLFAWSITEVNEESKPNKYIYFAPHTLIKSSELPNEERRSLTKVNLTSVFIQTDKPAYKPDDLVRIRVITMGSDDLPHLTAGVNITITDSQKNVMKKWEQPTELPKSTSASSNVSSNGSSNLFGEFQKKTNGLSAYEYQLSDEPILGNWTIEVQAGNIKEKVFFDVKKYILPKFQVKLHVPPVLFGTGSISTSAKIEAFYTYGKGLEGTGNLILTSHYAATQRHRFELKNGEAAVPLTLINPQGYSSTVYTIATNVTEKNTGRWKTGTATFRIFPRETYFIDWINKPSSYKPGIPMTVQLKITGQDGYPVKSIRSNSLKITFSKVFDLPARGIAIPLSGIANFSFPTPLRALSANERFEVRYEKAVLNFTLPPAQNGTSSKIFIDVIPPPDSTNLIQGKSYNFTIQSSKLIQPKLFHCLLWNDAAMGVHGAHVIINKNSEPAKEFPFSLQLPKGSYTDLKVFVYFETENSGRSEIISTFKTINTHNYLKIRVSRPIPVTATTPAAGTNNSSADGITQVNSTVVPSPDAPLETTAASTNTLGTTTETPMEELEYSYVDIEIQNDDPGAAAAAPEPEPQQEPLISDKLQVQPGDPVQIHFETYPDSTIAIRGIDQSLLLLTEQDNDLNQEKVNEKRASAEMSRKSHLDNITMDNSTFFKTFHRLGIAILSNERFSAFDLDETTIEKDNIEEDDVAPSENSLVDGSRIPEVDTRLRTKFPETWLWEEFQSSNDSSITVLSKTLPDTLTSWIISGFSLNPETGLGVASPATITGFMQFFVTLNLPYSVIKLESFDLQVIVHNYLDRDVNVYVTLFNKQNSFSFVDERDQTNGNGSRYIKVAKNEAAVAHFLITPMVIGDISLEVRAVTEDGTAGDSMIRPLKVKPDGVRESRTQVVVFQRPQTNHKRRTREATFDVEFPKDVVEGGSSLRLTVVGNQMGSMVSNLGHLLRLPGGCGEQNMARFVPNVLALNFLNATNSVEKEIIKQAKTNLQRGYGHQLQYRKRDGSFAVWAQLEGTTWLTSYVLRWFVEAQKFATIDPRVIKGAVDFLLKNQRRDGSFVETGPRYHPEMYSEAGSSVALSAYITLALIKANEMSRNDLKLKVAIEKGMSFISQASVYQLDDNYVTNIVTATLMAGNHPQKTRFFEKMMRGANKTITTNGMSLKCWGMKNSRERATDPLAIEMTSYALLAHLWKKGKLDGSAVNIYRWLLNQRNPHGGFISTQDTTMGLTALTEFAVKTLGFFAREDELDLNIQASSNLYLVNKTELSVSVARWNRMVLQEFNLPVSTKGVNIYARGSGPALIQMTESWYVPVNNRVSRRTRDHFNITAQMTIPDPEEPSETELMLCVNSFNVKGSKDSIASIQLPSGYAFDTEDYEEDSELMASRPRNVQRFELKHGNTKMEVYYTEIPAASLTCIRLYATQQIRVADAKNAPIVVYEYLNPVVKGTVSYEPAHKLTTCQLCRNTGGCRRTECN